MISIARTFGAPETVPAGEHSKNDAALVTRLQQRLAQHHRDQAHAPGKTFEQNVE